MSIVSWPAIRSYFNIVAMLLFHRLGTAMATGTEGLQRTIEKQFFIAFVRNDMIGYRCCYDQTFT